VSGTDSLPMMTSAHVFITMAAVTTVSFPATRQYDVTWSTTIYPHEVDPRLLHSANATGSDITARNDSATTKTAKATQRPAWTYYPFPYDSKLGWYTAAIISGLILAFLLCEGIERAKHAIIDRWEAR